MNGILRDAWVSRHHAFRVVMTRLSVVASRSRLTPATRRAELAPARRDAAAARWCHLGTEAHSSAPIAGKEPQFTKIVVTVAPVQKPLICKLPRC
jgi:hypothetical protein